MVVVVVAIVHQKCPDLVNRKQMLLLLLLSCSLSFPPAPFLFSFTRNILSCFFSFLPTLYISICFLFPNVYHLSKTTSFLYCFSGRSRQHSKATCSIHTTARSRFHVLHSFQNNIVAKRCVCTFRNALASMSLFSFHLCRTQLGLSR